MIKSVEGGVKPMLDTSLFVKLKQVLHIEIRFGELALLTIGFAVREKPKKNNK